MSALRGPIGIVTGLAAEAALARRELARCPDLAVIACAGPGPGAAARAAGALPPVSCLVSLGYAGGLDAALAPGALVLPERIVDGEGRSWAAADLGLPGRGGTLIGVDRPVATAAEKGRIHARTGSLAVDTESHAIAAVAAERGIPVAAIRAVLDGAGVDLPAAALLAVDEAGAVRVAALLRALPARRGGIASLIGLAVAAARARATLRRALAALARS